MSPLFYFKCIPLGKRTSFDHDRNGIVNGGIYTRRKD